MPKPKIIVICGPTASGKTKLGIEVAKKLDGEIISADSMQIYREMSIGSSKPTDKERQEAVHHLIDFVPIDKRYSVADYKKDAENVITEILSRGKVPIIVGGTGLYINSIIYNINYLEIKTDLKYREEYLDNVPLNELYSMAKEIDSEAISKISNNDRKRISRILEIYHTTGKTKTEIEKESRGEINYDFRVFVLNWDRDKLYERINKRVDIMMENGLLEEVKSIYQNHKDFPTSMQAIGYKELRRYLEGEISKEDAVDLIKKETRHYAKRQLTWFRTYKEATWLDGENDKNSEIIVENYNN